MSSFSRIHRFCTSDGTLLTDEGISLDDYLALDVTEEVEKAKDTIAEAKPTQEVVNDEPTDSTQKKAATGVTDVQTKNDAANPALKPKVPKLSIYYRTPPRVATAGMDFTNATGPALNMAMRPMGGVGAAVNSGLGGSLGLDANGYPLPPGQPPGTTAPPLTSMIGADKSFGAISAGASASVTAGELSETQWNNVLRNCAVFYGLEVDKASGQITRAPRAAFQLRSNIEGEPVASIPMFAIDPEVIARKKAEADDVEYEKSLFERVDVDHEVIERVERQSEQGPQRADLPQPTGGDQVHSKTIK